MSFLLRGLQIASKQIVYLLIILATMTMLVMGVVYWLANAVEQRQDEIAVWVGDKLGYPVEIGHAGLSWIDLKPKLQVDAVTVFRQDTKTALLSVESLYVGLDLFSSLQRGEPVLNDISLTGLNTTLVRDQTGHFQLQGLNAMPQSSLEAIDWLSWAKILNRIQVQAVTVNYIDQINDVLSGHYQLTNTELTHNSGRWTATGLFLLPSTLGSDVYFSGQWLLNSDDLQASTWQWQTQIRDVALAPFSQQIAWQDLVINNGKLTADISASGVGDTINSVQTDIDLTQAELASRQEDVAHAPVLIEHLIATLNWQQQAQSWQLSGHEIQINMNGDTWPTTDFSIKKQHDNSWVIASNYLRLSDLTAVASLSALSPEIIKMQQPAGDLDRLNLHYSEEDGVTKLAFNIRDGVMLPWQDYPGVTGLTAALNWHQGIANIKLDSHQVTFYPETWLDKAIFFDSVTGELSLQQQDQFWALQSDALHLWNDDLSIQLDGKMQQNSDGKISNDLKIIVQDVIVDRWQTYVPQKVLSKNFKKWSKNAFVAGNIIDGTIELKGDLDTFPYEDEPEKGFFKMTLQAENVQLHYGPGWPDLFDVSGIVTALNNDLNIKSQSGEIAGFQFADVNATINKLIEDEPILHIEGHLKGTTADALSFLQNSPLKQRFGKIAKAAKAQGPSDIQLSLMVPLADEDATEVSGNVSFINSQLQSKAYPELAISKLNGKLYFTNDGVTAKNIKASAFNAPVNINVSPKDDATVILATSQVSMQQIDKQWSGALPKFISGETAYEMEVIVSEKEIGEFDVDASIQSNLQGITIDLPKPFAKTAKETSLFRASTKQEGNIPVYSVEYGTLINAILAQDGTQWRGEVNVGVEQAKLPNHGVKIQGQFAELSLDKWFEWSKQYGGQKDNLLIDNINEIAVTTGELTGFNQQLTDVTVTARKETQGWRANINSAQSKGSVYWPIHFDNNTALKVKLDKLVISLPKSDEIQQITDEQAKFLWPTMDLAIDSLILNDMALGQLQLQGHRVVDAWLLDKGTLTSRNFTASILTGKWQQTANNEQSHFEVQVNSDNLARLLTTFGYQQTIDAKDVYLLADLSWPDNPLAVSTKILNGSLKVGLGNGKLKDVEPGAAGRIFGLMSIAALPRRLALDFSDLFSNGFYFNSIKGSFNLANGQAITNDFELKGPSANIKMVGPIDLINQMYDQKVTITPNVSSTLPLAGAVAGGPIGLGVGTAILLVDKLAGALFDKNIVNLISYSYYLTGPWDYPELTIIKPPTQ